MRLSKLISWMLLCSSLAFVASVAHAQPTTRVAGRIVAAKVTGTVTATNIADGSQRQLATNDALSQGYNVVTGAGSSVVLVFSNGASLNIGAESTLSIDEFLQDPFSTAVQMSDLTEEPTTSTTRVNLTRGELVGNVKRLKHEQGSSFTVNTPVGAAGIRGTTFRIVFRPDASGQVFFTLSTAEGTVLFEAPAAAGVSVETGKEVIVTVDVTVDPDTGEVTTTVLAIDAPADMPVETQTAIAAQAQEITEAHAELNMSTSTSSTVPIPPSSGNAEDDAAPNPVPASRTTPGDGQ